MEMTQHGAEVESLLRQDQRNGAHIKPYGFTYGPVGGGGSGSGLGERGEAPEKVPFLRNEPVRLTPAWEGANLPNDTLNLKGVGMELSPPWDRWRLIYLTLPLHGLGTLTAWNLFITAKDYFMSRPAGVGMELSPPRDRWRLIYLTLLLHGLGTLTAWNMFITAKDYFEKYKLAGTGEYETNFLNYIGLASQVPNLLFSWVNVFLRIGGDLTTRIVWSLSAEVMVFVVTVVLAMVDSSTWRIEFFWITVASVAVLNTFNSIFQNSVYGVAARLPPQYTGAVVLGSNVSGTLTVLLGWASKSFAGSERTAAIYYFISGMLILLACFDTYFALPLNRFYRYHVTLATRTRNPALPSAPEPPPSRPPYGHIARACSLQLFNVFFIFFVSLAVFPSVHSFVKPSTFMETDSFMNVNFITITCYLTFNFMAMIGNLTASVFTWPGPRVLTAFTVVRVLFIPFFLLCNYRPSGVERTLPVYIHNDWLYWAMAALLGWSSGHGSSLAMMYVGRNVSAEHAATAGMMGAACLVTGLVAGISFSRLAVPFVSAHAWSALVTAT